MGVIKISDDESVNLIKECIERKHGENAAKVRVAVINLQVVPKVLFP